MSNQEQNQNQDQTITLLNIDSLNEALKHIKKLINSSLTNSSNDLDGIIQIVDSYKAIQLSIACLDKLQKVAVELDKNNKNNNSNVI